MNHFKGMTYHFLAVIMAGLLVGPGWGISGVRESPYSRGELLRLGPQKTFEGKFLNEIAFPLGGVGTGTVSLGGRGNLRDWEIFNRPSKGVDLPLTFFALWFRQDGDDPLLRILEGPLRPPFREDYGHGYSRGEVPGLPRMDEARFRSHYPFAEVKLSDSRIPLDIELEAFNPFIPLDPEASGFPAAIIRFRIKNIGKKKAQITIVGSIMNPIGFDGTESLDLRTVNGTLKRACFGGNLNEIRKEAGLTGLFMSSQRVKRDSHVFGTMALSSPWPRVTYLSHWVRGEWFEDFHTFLDDLMEDGRFADLDEQSPSSDGRTDMGSLGLAVELAPGEEAVLPFYLTWHFPNFLNYFDRLPEERGKIYKNHYATRFSDAWDVVLTLFEDLPQLEEKSRCFSDLFFSQTLPPYVLEAVSSQASIIRTPSCFWLSDGNFFAFEGTNVNSGCCPLNCTHVWNYAQSLAFLFPGLERSMRRTDFLNNVKPDGEMAFRTTLPLASGKYWKDYPYPAADGQMGTIIRLFRDWQISGDMEFLKEMWPLAKLSLEYAWQTWDTDRDGILRGKQHNTFDIEFYGTSSMTGTLYLGALLAGAQMAAAAGDSAAAVTYREVFEKGKERLEKLIWNGDYYIQHMEDGQDDKFQYGTGCISDQVLGQWLAMVAGLGRFLRTDQIRTALLSIYRNNFITDFKNFYHGMRTFALQGERGLVNCTWPQGNRPAVPFVYASEVWTGTEYQVASHLIYEDLIEEGLTIVRAVRDRYDGWKRNPWSEEESGNHYVRAMSSWAVLLALSGFTYSGPDQRMGFDPKVSQENFRCFWSAGTGWGSYSQKSEPKSHHVSLRVDHGLLELEKFSFRLSPAFAGKRTAEVDISIDGIPVSSHFEQIDDMIFINWETPVHLQAGGRSGLSITVRQPLP